MAGLAEALAEVTADKKARGKADKRYVAFSTAEWDALEAAHGKRIEPVDVKKLVQAIFSGRFNLTAGKK